MLESEPQEPIEYSYSEPQQSPRHLARLQSFGAAMYDALGIRRDDKEGREEQRRQNAISFGAPVLLVCYLERFHTAPQWSDMGMWLQTIMLLLREEGLDSCPQEWMALHGRLIKEQVGVSDADFIFFCGLAIGRRQPNLPVNNYERERVPLDEQVRFLGFD
jgi:nitroreductase